MVRPNWDVFKVKFSENPQDNFQWLCYLLFCKEFNKPLGISAYQNQRHIETNPITVGDEVIGWQAKFYDTPLTSHKTEIIELLKGSKKDYPDISKVIFYTNKDWGQGKNQNDPQQKIDIDAEAKKLGINIDWEHMANFFGSPFVTDTHQTIAQHFFVLDGSVLDVLDNLKRHTENILSEINTTIDFSGKSIAIDRKEYLDQLNKGGDQILIVSGLGGAGKTAVIKDYYNSSPGIPFFIFKATEFNLQNINELFPGSNLKSFAGFLKSDETKVVVIDSAEKLIDLPNVDPFKEFIACMICDGWKIIFTTRNEYLDVLNADFLEVHKIAPLNIHIPILGREELQKISSENNFSIPSDSRLVDLLRNPFYLGEYLKFYKQDEVIDYTGFKGKIWDKTIVKSNPPREECFLSLAWKRAEQGSFYVNADNGQSELCNALKKDGVLGYESPHGYFIAHDIYEEWALERIIEREFLKRTNDTNLFDRIGHSLPVRRSFRKWLGEKLLLEDKDIKDFIDKTIKDATIQQFWKDEILISVLRSGYANIFFENFIEELLGGNFALLKKITFLLRIACKEIDNSTVKALGLKDLDLSYLGYILTKPSGPGWESLVKFIAENLEKIGVQNVHFILPIIYDWNHNFRTGETTKHSSKIALQYYQWIIQEDVFVSDKEFKNKILHTITFGASEIKDELSSIFDEVLKNGWKTHRSPYYDLCKIVLTEMEGIPVSKVLPSHVLKLADLFWTFTPKDSPYYSRSGMDIGEEFNLEADHLEYYPASAYQTPIYWLLQTSLQETINFILQFTNKSVEYFAKSEFAKYEVEKVELHVDTEKPQKQWISHRLWCMYRGTQVAPHVLEAMHMALEKFFLEQGEHTSQENLESWLMYMLRNSRSASITGVVVSIILAYPEKTFNIAKVLFQTKDFFQFDTARFVLDQTAKSTFQIGYGLGDFQQKIHQDERIKSCDDKHRSLTLENLFLSYQFFRSENTTEEEADKRQKALWQILDNYYQILPAAKDETEADKTWRLCLARMDRRKMKPTTEETEGGTLIHFNPEIDPELKEYSEQSLAKTSEPTKHTALKLWASYRMRNDEKYKQYDTYEKDPISALSEAKEVITKLQSVEKPKKKLGEHSEGETFFLFNQSIPVEVCSVLIKHFFNKLSPSEAEFCKGIIMEAITSSLGYGYHYQISDGTQSALSVLPDLFTSFPEERKDIKTALLISLFNDSSVDMANTRFNIFPATAVHALREKSPEDAESILLGYLLLKPKYEELRDRTRTEARKQMTYGIDETQVLKDFFVENAVTLEKMVKNEISIDDLGSIDEIDLSILQVAFQLIPVRTSSEGHKDIVKKIISAFAKQLLSDDREDRVDYIVRHNFLKKLAFYVLTSPQQEIKDYLKPFVDGFRNAEPIADLFEEFISAQDQLDAHDNFWEVWNLFKQKMIDLGKKGDRYIYAKKIIKSYLFAQNPWKEGVTEWHTLKDTDSKFFRDISQAIGCPSALYSISKLLNDVGSIYLDEGIGWITHMVSNNEDLLTEKLEVNTIYYLENICRKYIYKDREKIRKNTKLKQEILTVLDFLIEKGSVTGYMLRENIL